MIENEGVRRGWYPDPAAPDTQRYWDGEQWVGESLPVEAAPPTGPIMSRPQPVRTPEVVPVPLGTGPAPIRSPGSPEKLGISGIQRDPVDPVGAPALAFPLAGLGSRFTARLIDISIVFALNLVANGWFAYQYLQVVKPYWNAVLAWNASGAVGDPPEVPERAGTLMFLMLLILIAVWGAYEVPAVASTGQTIGKRLTGIQVIRLDSPDKVGVGRSLRRWANMSIPTLLWHFCGLGLIIQIFDALSCVRNRPYQQCIHDRAVRTVVVNIYKGERS